MTSKRLEIKKVLLTVDEIIILVALINIFVFGWGKLSNCYFLIAIILVVVFLLKPIKRVFDRKTQYVFDKEGIHNKIQLKSYSINEIENVEVNSRVNNKLEICFKYHKSLVVLNLDYLNVSSKEIKGYFIEIAPSKLKDKEQHQKVEFNSIIENITKSDKILEVFKHYKRTNSWIMALMFFGILGVAIVLQIVYPFHYSFAFGWLTMWCAIFYYNKFSEKRLRSIKLISKLTDEHFDKLIQFDLRISNKKEKNIANIAMAILTIFIFIGSFALGQ